MREKEVIKKAINKLIALGMTEVEAIERVRETYFVRLEMTEKNSKEESAVVDGLAVLHDLSRAADKNNFESFKEILDSKGK